MGDIKIIEVVKGLLFNREIKFSDSIPNISIDDAIDYISLIPKVGSTLSSLMSIRDKFLLKKLECFIWKINQSEYNEAIEKRRMAAQNNEKWFEKEVELVILFLDRFENSKKALIAAQLYLRYLNQKSDRKEWLDNMTVLDRLFLADINQLMNSWHYKQSLELIRYEQANNEDKSALKIAGACCIISEINCERLISCGLMTKKIKNVYVNDIYYDYILTEKGKIFGEIIDELEDVLSLDDEDFFM